jgi:anti-sigma regulatory factor (Ser/Thr protein kinase)
MSGLSGLRRGYRISSNLVGVGGPVQTATNPVITTTEAASFPAEPISATAARRFVSRILGPVVDEDVMAVVALLTTELAANSVLHARTPIDVEVTVADHEVRVEVRDRHPGSPRRMRTDPLSTFGRGLTLVEALSDRWGVTPRAGGKGVWFSLTR